MPDNSVFETLVAINVNDHTETKDTGSAKLTYLSWPWAWSEVKRRFPTASYEIIKDPVTHLPYSFDPSTGYMCYTSVTIGDVTHQMWLPVMDSQNRAMRAEPYTIKTKYKDILVQPATMFDINKTIMRCLVKNLAMFGLGLYIYAGEDLPEGDDESLPIKKPYPPKPKKEPEPDGLKPIGEDMPFTMGEAPKPADPPKFVCEKCGAVLKPYIGPDGKEIPIRKHAEGSKKKFGGKVFCLDCINAYLKPSQGE